MRLYSGKIASCGQDIVRTLVQSGDIETSNLAEAQLDVESVLKEYLRTEREIIDKAKDTMEARNLGREQFGRVKRLLAEERGFGLGEDAIGWIADQVIEVLMHSPNIEEVFADDSTLRAHMREVLRKHMAADEELEAEVRKRIQNLQEGTADWEIEYKRAMENIKRAKGLE
ncbi:MAG: DUF507 family protein [Myxococcota bacterium]